MTLKILIHKQQHDAYTQHQTFFFPNFCYHKQKEQAINLRQKYFHSYDTYTLIILHQNRKGTSNKFALEIFSSL